MFSKRTAIVWAAVAALGFSTAVSQASMLTLLDPALVNGDTAAIATSAQADIGYGSWQAPAAASSVYLTPAALGLGSSLALSDIQSISWNTYKTAADGANDWFLTIYTTPTGTGDAASWYHNRITFEPLYAYNHNDPTDQWVTWSTDSGPNQVTFYDSAAGQTAAGFVGGPTLDDLISGTVNWGDYANSGSTQTVDYSGDTIASFVLQTSNWTPSYQGYLDNFSVNTSGGNVQVDFDTTATAPVPEPASLVLLGMGGLCLLAGRRRRRVA